MKLRQEAQGKSEDVQTFGYALLVHNIQSAPTTPLASSIPFYFPSLDFALEVVPRHQVRDIIVVVIRLLLSVFAFLLLHALVALGQFAQRGERVRAQLVEDARDQLREFFVLAVSIDGKGVGGHGGVDCDEFLSGRRMVTEQGEINTPLGAAK